MSSGAEDEGISFSERSSSPEEQAAGQGGHGTHDNDRETTIEDVIEELRIIVKDAEEELEDWSPRRGVAPSKARECLRSSEETARLDRGLKILVPGPQVPQAPQATPAPTPATPFEDLEDAESAIVPAIIHPQPPRRPAACPLFPCPGAAHPEGDEDDEELLLLEDDGSDSLLSASRLNYHQALKLQAAELADLESSEAAPSRGPGSRHGLHPRASNAVQRRTERRKYLRRCQSQEQIEPRGSPASLQSRASAVLEHIRKFESLTGLEGPREAAGPTRLRRSESFHQTRHSSYCSSSRGGSDSGLAYLHHQAAPEPEPARHRAIVLTKSLDRIDEGLDARATDALHRHHVADDPRKYTSFHEGRRKSAEYTENYLARHLLEPTDSRIFAGRPHDVLGFARSRFNAGKYSGVHPPGIQQKPAHRPAAPPHHLLGKLTDVVSGLY